MRHEAEQFGLLAVEERVDLGVPKDTSYQDIDFTPEDQAVGDRLAELIGDTWINHDMHAPIAQWMQIVRALRHHGMKVVNVEAKE
jgi:hypothetical protein